MWLVGTLGHRVHQNWNDQRSLYPKIPPRSSTHEPRSSSHLLVWSSLDVWGGEEVAIHSSKILQGVLLAKLSSVRGCDQVSDDVMLVVKRWCNADCLLAASFPRDSNFVFQTHLWPESFLLVSNTQYLIHVSSSQQNCNSAVLFV